MAKCKNCTKCLMGEDVFIHGARVYPFCGVDGEEVENLDEDKECIDFECMTNADRIRNMTDEELADFIEMKQFFALANNGTDGEEYTLAWLKSEVGCE